MYRPDQTTLYTGFPRLSSPANLTLASSFAPLATGTYYWGVRSVDRAGNVGALSPERACVLQ